VFTVFSSCLTEERRRHDVRPLREPREHRSQNSERKKEEVRENTAHAKLRKRNQIAIKKKKKKEKTRKSDRSHFYPRSKRRGEKTAFSLFDGRRKKKRNKGQF